MINYPDGRKYTSAQTPTEKPKKSKYGAVKTEVDGIMFDSKREASRYQELRLLEQAGDSQPPPAGALYTLSKNEHGRALKYIADFVYNDDTGALVVEDAKGHSTDVYKIKRRLMAELKGIEIKETIK